jgi:hypothetical protein
MAEPISAFPIPPEGTGRVEARQPKARSRTTQFPVSPSSAAGDRYRDVIQQSFRTACGVLSNTFSALSRRVRYLADERPIQLLAGVAAASFLVGAALRIWRSSRYE